MENLVDVIYGHGLLAFSLTPVIYLLAEAIYNIYFHPLADVPGPFWCNVSGWLQGDRFRYRPDRVLIATPKGYREIYSSKANVKKAKWYEVWRRNNEDYNALNTTDSHKHMVLRKPLNSAFSEKALRSSEPFIIKNVDRWIELMLDGEKTKGKIEWATPKNLGGEWVDYLVTYVLGSLLRRWKSRKTHFVRFHISLANIIFAIHVSGKRIPQSEKGDTNLYVPQISNSPFLNAWVWLKPRGIDKLLAMITPKPVIDFYKFLKTCEEEREKQEQSMEKNSTKNERKDMFQYLFQAKDSGTGAPAFNHTELVATANLLLVKEIRDTFSSAEDIRSSVNLSNCKYLQACCLEAMRMSPSGPSELLRQVLPGVIEIDGCWYPENTLIGVPSYSLYYHQETFKDPFVFRPERWIPNDEVGIPAEHVAALQESLKPFSIGAGQCPGKSIALLEMYMTLARNIHSCDIRRPLDDTSNHGAGKPENIWGRRNKNQYQVVDAFLALRNGPVIQLRRRVHK
ncbi:hypothetical protein EAF00_001112 [Botryotinia globosa]|nr:hypothetical protein EAF00_001112 [Botryotinia globosa]